MQKIYSLEEIVKGLEVAENRLTNSINTLKLEKENVEKDLETIKENKILAEKDYKDSQKSRQQILSGEIESKQKELVRLQKETATKKDAISNLETDFVKQRGVIKIALQNEKNSLAKSMSANRGVRETNDYLARKTQIDKATLVKLQTEIQQYAKTHKISKVQLSDFLEKISFAKKDLVEIESLLQKTKDLYNSKEYADAKQVIASVRANKLTNNELSVINQQLQQDKDDLVAKINKLAEKEEEITKDRQTLREMRGALIQKDNSVSQRVDYLKNLYGELNLPW